MIDRYWFFYNRYWLFVRLCTRWPGTSFCSVTAHVHRKSRVRSNNTTKRNVNVTLVYLLLFAVELLCCEWHAVQLISFTDLLTFADNTCLLEVSLHTITVSIHLPLIYAIWYYAVISLYEWMAERRMFSFRKRKPCLQDYTWFGQIQLVKNNNSYVRFCCIELNKNNNCIFNINIFSVQ